MMQANHTSVRCGL